MVASMTSEVSTKCPQNSDFSFLPSKDSKNLARERIFRTSLSANNFVRLESEASQRGTTPFELAGLILAAYLDGKFSSSG